MAQPGHLATPLQARLRQAAQCLHAGDVRAAETILAPLLIAAPGAGALHLMGLVRARQGRAEDAAALLARALALEPRRPQVQFHLGKLLMQMRRFEPAVEALRAAAALKPDFAEAWYDLGNALQETGQLADAEKAYRRLLRLAPGDAYAKLALGWVVLSLGRPDEAEAILKRGLLEAADPALTAALHHNLAIALHKQRKRAEALSHIEKAQALDPGRDGLDVYRVDILQEFNRHDEALALLEKMLARDPANPTTHMDYNDLLYRLGRDAEFLQSYDRAPRTAALQLSKASFLIAADRPIEAHDIYADILARDPDDKGAGAGRANALARMGRHGEAVTAYETVLARHRGDAGLYGDAGTAAIQHGDPAHAVRLCEKGLALSGTNQNCLAVMGTALRLMADERDEILNGYDTLIRVFDLEPPRGFSSMADFNAELGGFLERIQPDTREYIFQTLRGGSQTLNILFGAGHGLVDRLQERIGEAVARYIAELKEDETHPFLARRTRNFAFAGSWSSRLRDCGFHVSHMHPAGWISSCYYVGVPDVARDAAARQGWIKFGEPGFAAPLKDPVRRAIQPEPGRLVLFPSYMWHGTIPFHAPEPRVTIAFDAVPA